ncbi:MAG: site-specific integrase [Chloroflexota bacterium]
MGTILITPGKNGRLNVQFRYSPERVSAIKDVPGRVWHPEEKFWSVPSTPETLRILHSCFLRDRIVLSKDMTNALPGLPTEKVDVILASFDEVLTAKGYSDKTRENYRLHIQWFLNWFRREPALATNQDVKDYLLWNIDLKRAASYIRQAKAALRVFFEHVVARPEVVVDLPYVKTPNKLPVILSRDEVKRLLNATGNLKEKALLSMAYSAGLRISEVTRLKVSDILSDRGQVHVCDGKGRKDRYTILADQTLQTLRAYYLEYQPWDWLFPGVVSGEQLSISTAERIFRRARKKSGINSKASMHALRHSFATHLHEAGTDIRYIQELLGHIDIRTTARYTQVSKRTLSEVRSPLDSPPLASGEGDEG